MSPTVGDDIDFVRYDVPRALEFVARNSRAKSMCCLESKKRCGRAFRISLSLAIVISRDTMLLLPKRGAPSLLRSLTSSISLGRLVSLLMDVMPTPPPGGIPGDEWASPQSKPASMMAGSTWNANDQVTMT